MPETVVCEICGSAEQTEIFIGRDRLLGLPGEFRVVQCPHCSLIYTNPRPSSAELGRYYPKEYGVYSPTGARAHRIRLYHRRIARMLHRNPPGRLLDIGCGEGTFLSEMKALGWQTGGLEMDSEAAALAKKRYDIDVTVGAIDEADFPRGQFDLITMSHLLEHVPHPRVALGKAATWLAPGGRLFITLPNADCWERRRFGEHWYPWDLPRHLFHFSPATLRRLLEEEGYRVTTLGFVTGLFVPQSLRYQRSPGPETPSGPMPEGGGPKETLKTVLFKTNLAIGALAGRFVKGEVMEIIAVRKER